MSSTGESGAIRVTAGLIRREGQVLICRRPPGDALAGKWEFPGGKIEAGESAEACLARELDEELGLHVEVGAHLMTVEHAYPGKVIQLIFHEVTCPGDVRDAKAHDRVEWVMLDQLVTYDFAPADVPFVEWLASSRKSSA